MKLIHTGTVAELLFKLQAHLVIPDYYVVGKDVDLMISRAVGLVGCINEINALSEIDQTDLFTTLRYMGNRTKEYADLNEDLIKELTDIVPTSNRLDYLTDYLSILRNKRAVK